MIVTGGTDHEAQVENVRRFLAAKEQYRTDARTAVMISALLFIQAQWQQTG